MGIDAKLLRSVVRDRKLTRRTQMYRDAVQALRTHLKADRGLPDAIWDDMYKTAIVLLIDAGMPEGGIELAANQLVVSLVGDRQQDLGVGE